MAHTPQIGICPSAGSVGVGITIAVELVIVVVSRVVEVFDDAAEMVALVASVSVLG